MSDANSAPRIHRLPDALSNQIAAGEVVERPASVLKELLENAIDAGAGKISIELSRGGNKQVRVTDNGYGIHPDDLLLAIEKHSTSKIATAEDLAAIESLGFRGEALASISSVSRFRLQSTYLDNNEGYCVTTDPAEPLHKQPVAHPRGTTVEVRDLFYNTPARRKFLRAETTEYLHSLNLIKRIAISQFDVAFQVKHNGRQVMRLASVGADYSRRVADVCGQTFLDESLALDFSSDSMRLWGWLGTPASARSQVDRQYFFINGRLVRDKHVNHAIRLAFQEHLYPGRYPCFVLFLQIDTQLVDVNVHPSKHEVRFSRSRDVHDFIYACLKQVLTEGQQNQFGNMASFTAEQLVNSEPVPGTEIRESDQAYGRDHTQTVTPLGHMKFGSLKMLLANRYAILEVENGFGLLDTFKARELLASGSLLSELKQEKVRSRPLLIPFEIGMLEGEIDSLEEQQEILSCLGIVFSRVAPDRLLLRELPTVLKFAQPQQLVLDILHRIQRPPAQVVSVDDLMAVLLEHVNDTLVTGHATVEIDKLLKELSVSGINDKQLAEVNAWRSFNEDAIGKLFD